MANRGGSRIVPLTLGVAMFAVVLAAGLFPNAGTVQAQSSCPYGGCTTSSSIPVWEYASIFAIIALAAIVALLVIMRRRRPPSAASVAPPAAAGGGAVAAAPPWAEGPAAPEAPVAPYIETPEDVGHPPPSVSVPPSAPAAAAAGGAAAAGAAGGEASSDIDSLMAELDKISTEILRKAPKKASDGKGADDADDDLGKSA